MAVVQAEKKKTETGTRIFRVCYVCTGNTCRSPMAQAYYNHTHRGQPTVAESAGISARDGAPIHPLAEQALGEAGVTCTEANDYEHHAARMLTEEIVDRCDRIVCMTPRHAMAVLCAFPHAVMKITDLGDIDDPWGGDIDDYRRTLDAIREAIDSEK